MILSIAGHETATNQLGGLSSEYGNAEAKFQTSAWTRGRNCSGRQSPADRQHPRATNRFEQGIVELTRGVFHPKDAGKRFLPLPNADATCERSSPMRRRFPRAAVRPPASGE